MRADESSRRPSWAQGSGAVNALDLKLNLVVFNGIRVVGGVSHVAWRDHHPFMISHDGVSGTIEKEGSVEDGRRFGDWRYDRRQRLTVHADEHVIRRQPGWAGSVVTTNRSTGSCYHHALTKQVHEYLPD